MEQKADVLEQVEGPWGCRAFVHLLLVLWLMRIYAFENAKSPEKSEKRNHLSATRFLSGKALQLEIEIWNKLGEK